MSRLILFSARSEPVEPDPKLDALGNELKAMAAAMSKDPAQFFMDPNSAQVTRLKALVEEIQSIGKQELDRIVAKSKDNAEKAKALAAEMEAKKKQKEAAAAASQPQKKDWPPDTGGLRLTFWFEKEFTPPEDQTKALTASVVELVQKKKPSVPSSSWKPRQ
jgi:septum formation inhibitor MinC